MKVFLSVPGIAGDATAAGFQGQIECQAASYELAIPTDPNTGQRLGPRVHKPVLLTKTWDRASLRLADALVKGTVMSSITISFVKETPSFGAVQLVLRLSNVRVVSIDEGGAQGGAALPTEKVSLTFSSAEFSFTPDGTSTKVVIT